MRQTFNYLKSNKGSGIVTVMLAVLFLTAFGTLALYLSYTSLKVSYAERTGMETEVNAYTCMDEVRAGVQQLTSDAISETYNEIMPQYTQKNQDISKSFRTYFNEVIVRCNYTFTNSSGVKEIDSALFTDNATKYDIVTLEKMIREKRGYSVDIYSGSMGIGNGTAGKGTVETTYEKDDDGNYVLDDSGNKVPLSYTLKDITLKFSGKDHRTSTITTDIVIECPDVGYLLTQYSIKGIPNFAMVANGKILQNAANKTVTVTGDVYAGSVELENNSTFKVINYSTMIVKDTISINGNNQILVKTTDRNGNTNNVFGSTPRLELDKTTTLWAGRIEVGSLSSAGIYGNTYLKDDLEFKGNNSNVKLGSYLTNTTRRTGSFYGFGSSITNPKVSSSIIANREGNKLSLEELGSLTLAGYTFISNSTRTNFDGEETGIRMGESVSGKYNQMVYYTGSEKVVYYEYHIEGDQKVNSTGHYIEGTYPNCRYYSFDEDGNKIYYTETYSPKMDAYTIEQEKMAVISKEDFAKIVKFGLAGETYKWENGKFVIDTTTGDNGYSESYINDALLEGDPLYQKTFADYHAHLSPVYEIVGQQYIVHFLLSFATPDDANNYFIDTFNSNPLEIKNELASHLNMTGLNSGIANTASGSIYRDDSYNDISAALTQTIDEIRKNAEFIEKIFNNYCTTLSNEKPDDSSANNPFDTYIYREKIEENDDFDEGEIKQFKNTSGEIVALVINGDYDYTTASPDTICLIIASGNVKVSDDYNGLILTYGNIEITSNANFSQNYEAVLSAFQSKCGDEVIKDYFKRNITKNYTLDNGSAVENVAAYDIGTMVHYANWSE